MRLEQRPEKTCQKKKTRGKNMAGNLGRNRGSGSKQLALSAPRSADQVNGPGTCLGTCQIQLQND